MRKQPVLQTLHIGRVALDDANRAAACRTHAPLHGLPGSRAVIRVRGVRRTVDCDVFLWNHKSVRGNASRASLAGFAVAHQRAEV